MATTAEKLAANVNLGVLAQATELKKRILFVLGAFIVYRIGTYIPLPYIDPQALDEFMRQNSGGILGMFNMFSGGALGRMTIFALNIMPYITASIIMQLMTVVSKNLEEMKKEGDSGRRKINQYTRYLTVILAGFQGFGIAVGLESSSFQVVVEPGVLFRVTTVITLVGGTLFLMWLGEQMTARGIGNGISLIIFAGIVAELPSALASTFDLGRTGALPTWFIVFLLLLAISLIAFIIFMERAHRRIMVQYPKRQKGNKVFGGESSHIPLKLNTAGVIPAIFASSILLFPATIVRFGSTSAENTSILESIVRFISPGSFTFIVIYFAIITFFCFFYTSVVFNPDDTAENLRKNGGFIPGRRPGKNTAEYFDYVLTRLTVLGSLYLGFVCVIPELLRNGASSYSVPFYLGGTSLLIVVNVIMDTVGQIQTHLFAHQYEGLLKKTKLKGRRR